MNNTQSKLLVSYIPSIDSDIAYYERFQAKVSSLKIGFSVEDVYEVMDLAMVLCGAIFKNRNINQGNTYTDCYPLSNFHERSKRRIRQETFKYTDILQVVMQSKIPWKFMPMLCENSFEGEIIRDVINTLLDLYEDNIYNEELFHQAFKQLSFLHPGPNTRMRPVSAEEFQCNSNLLYMTFGDEFIRAFGKHRPCMTTMTLGNLICMTGKVKLKEFIPFHRACASVEVVEKLARERFLFEFNSEIISQALKQYRMKDEEREKLSDDSVADDPSDEILYDIERRNGHLNKRSNASVVQHGFLSSFKITCPLALNVQRMFK